LSPVEGVQVVVASDEWLAQPYLQTAQEYDLQIRLNYYWVPG